MKEYIPVLIGIGLVLFALFGLLYLQYDYDRKIDAARKRHIEFLNEWMRQTFNKKL